MKKDFQKSADAPTPAELGAQLNDALMQRDKIDIPQALDLIARGADLNIENKYGRYPLHMAVETGRRDLAEAMIKAGADLNIKNCHGNTPLHGCALYRRVDIAELLIDGGADLDARNSAGETVINPAGQIMPEIASRVLHRQRKQHQALYAAHFAGGMTAENLAAPANQNGMTGMMLATRMGRFGDVLDFYRAHPEVEFDLAVAQKQDKHKQSAFTQLMERNELQQIFDPVLWRKQPEGAVMLMESLERWDKRGLDKVAVARDMAKLQLARLKKPAGVTPR